MPFKRGERPAAATSANPSAAVAARVDDEPQGRAGESFAAGTTRVEISGRGLELPGVGIRAVLSLQAGASAGGVLVLTEGAKGELALVRVKAEAGGWSAPENVAALMDVAALGCSVEHAGARELDGSYVVVDVGVGCGGSVGTGTTTTTITATNQPGAAQALARKEQHGFVIATEAAPRLLEHVVAVTPEEPNALPLAFSIASRDFDSDGSQDLALRLAIGASEPPARVEIHLFNRAGGLALDSSEPENSVLALADQAKNARKQKPGVALELAQRALALHSILCRELGTARLYVGSDRGLACGTSLGAGRAASIVVAVLASQGKLLEALARYKALQLPAYQLTDNDWERARFALHSRLDDKSYLFRAGPVLELASLPRVRRAPIAFIDESHLLLLGTSPRVYDLGQSSTEPTGIPADAAIADPSGRFALSEITRSCDGYHLRVVLRAQIVAGVVNGKAVAEPLLLRAEPPLGAHCPELSREQREDDGGLHVLDWSTQGVLFARAEQLWLLPLAPPFEAGVEATPLTEGATPPALARSSELTPDGRIHAVITALGIALHDRKAGTTRLIAAPDGDGAIDTVALSPSGQALAIVRAGKLWLASQRAPSADGTGVAPTQAPTPNAPPTRAPPPAPSPPSTSAPPPLL